MKPAGFGESCKASHLLSTGTGKDWGTDHEKVKGNCFNRRKLRVFLWDCFISLLTEFLHLLKNLHHVCWYSTGDYFCCLIHAHISLIIWIVEIMIIKNAFRCFAIVLQYPCNKLKLKHSGYYVMQLALTIAIEVPSLPSKWSGIRYFIDIRYNIYVFHFGLLLFENKFC